MNDIKIIFETEEYIEVEITQPNNQLGDTQFWDDTDWSIWNEKMKRLEQEGTIGQEETINIKFQKKPFLNGAGFTRQVSDES